MPRSTPRLLLLPVLAFATVLPGVAAVSVPSVFSDHMVLQRGPSTPVWGQAAPGEAVTVALGAAAARTVADTDGAWKVRLDLTDIAGGPHEVIIEGTNRLVIADVLVGEVWIASGQSNMAQRLRHVTGGTDEARTARRPNLRMFDYHRDRPSLEPDGHLGGRWTVCDPSVAGDYSAIAYFHGRRLEETLQVPVGMVHISMGGTAVESWLSPEAVARDPDVSERRRRMVRHLETYPGDLAAFARSLAGWLREHGRADRLPADLSAWNAPGIDDSAWREITLPGEWAAQGLPDSGVVWLRKHIPVTAGMAGRSLVVKLGAIRDYAKVYWNGVPFGETNPDTPPVNGERWTYRVPAELVREGPAVLAVRVYSPAGGARLSAGASGSSFLVTADPNNSFYLRGPWRARSEYVLPALDDRTGPGPTIPPQPPELKSVPGVLYNGHVVPVRGYGARGFIWYQGEANHERAFRYRTTFPGLIADWRRQWGGENLPFLFCQLPGFGPPAATPGDSSWAELRESQALTARQVPRTAMAVLVDLGEEGDIHPRNKREAGHRLALATLGTVYGRDVAWQAAELVSAQVEGSAVRIRLAPTYGGLEARPLPATYRPKSTQPEVLSLVRRSPGDIEGLAICGADRRWTWAQGRIDGEAIVVWSPAVPAPVAVRYAWSDFPIGNLYSRGGLPVAPFRTDDFPLSTDDRPR